MRLISPPAAEHDSLRQPLTDGEKLVFEFFDRYLLDEEWEIYLQPHLNGLKPDFVLLHPRNGIAVFEVKDWNLDALHYSCEWSNDKPRLMASNGIKTFSKEKDNPVTKIELYKDEIFNLYCPRLQKGKGFGVITAGVIFPFTETKRFADLLKPFRDFRNMSPLPHLYPLIGADTIARGDIKFDLPRLNKINDCMSAEIAADMRAWLTEPSFVKDQRSPLELSSDQKRLITTRTATGYRRIKGSAGSGKSIVLAGRAAELASSGLNVLVCTYNITLINYLRDVSVRWKGTSAKNAITWLHFHALCKRILIESGYESEYSQLCKDYHYDFKVFDEKLTDLLLTVCSDTNDYSVYDAILVDEGQDFRPKWWQVLRKLVKPNGEMLLVADRTQDVYGTASAWTDEQMINSGFSGEWGSLDVSYRMPPKLIEITRQFAETFLPESLRQIPISLNFELDMYSCEIKWQQIHQNQIVDVTIEAVLDMMKIANPQERLAVADITIIVDSDYIGVNLSDKLNSDYSIRCIDTFDRDKSGNNESRRKKLGFFMGDARVKITTIQSFKGWEARLLVLVISKANSQQGLSAIYTGLTRLKRSEHGTSNLSVICSAPELEMFSNTLKIN